MSVSPHTLYRFFAADETLLYVGLTINPGRRFEKHANDKGWWREVARITMEQLPDLASLRAAEREAIIAERPLYNVRMNGAGAAKEKPVPSDNAISGLIGRWFHSWASPTDDNSKYGTVRNGLVLEWQGQVIERDDNIYIVQLYSWWDGCAGDQKIVTVADMRDWTFYDSHLEMQISIGCREVHDGADRDCGGEITHFFDRRHYGLGIHWLCSGCVRRYPGFHDAKLIQWHDGKPRI